MTGWPLRTERLAIRPVERADRDAFLVWRSIPEMVRFMYREPWTPEVADARFAEWVGAPFDAPGQWLVCTVLVEGRIVGETTLKWLEEGQGEIGYAIRPEEAGRGYATEAARAMVDLGFRRYGFHRVTARIDEENVASVAVAERLGMRREARLIESGLRPADGVWGTELVYAVLASEWPA